MREAQETCQCSTCKREFTQVYPVAESRDEYQACRAKLKGGYVVNDTGQARRKIPCPNSGCGAKILVTILDQRLDQKRA